MPRRKSEATVTGREATRIINDYAYLDCRAENHVWKRSGIEVLSEYRGRPSVVRVVRECQTCTAERRDVITLGDGFVVGRQYVMPKGYRLKGFGDLLPKRGDWRKQLYTALAQEV